MDWHIQYRDLAGDHIEMFATPERAIEGACLLMDQGQEVDGIGTGPLSDSINREQIDRIYDIWARVKGPFYGSSSAGAKRCASR